MTAVQDLEHLALDSSELAFILACCESEAERSDISDAQRTLIYFLRIRYLRRRRAEEQAASDVPPPRVVMHDQDSACARGIVHRPPCEAS